VSFFFVFLAVGAASRAAGLTLFQSTLMSLVVFAAPAQFVMLDLISHHRAWLDILGATAIVNSRFFVMSATLVPHFRGTSNARILAALPLLSASTFAVPFLRVKQVGDVKPFQFYLGVSMASYPVAVVATGLGLLVAQGVSPVVRDGLQMILPLYFATLLAGEWPRLRPVLAGFLGFVGTPVAEQLAPGYGLMLVAVIIGMAVGLPGGGAHG
jgi:predicted branched-subunit amino acid permease